MTEKPPGMSQAVWDIITTPFDPAWKETGFDIRLTYSVRMDMYRVERYNLSTAKWESFGDIVITAEQLSSFLHKNPIVVQGETEVKAIERAHKTTQT